MKLFQKKFSTIIKFFIIGILPVLAFSIHLISPYNKISNNSDDTDISNIAFAQTSGKTRLTGYAWSDNIGWISFNEGVRPVLVQSNGYLVGFAWAPSIGWVQFGNLLGFPTNSPSTGSNNARFVGDTITGWVRAVVAVPPSGVIPDNRGGWDGWIALNGATHTISKNISGNLSGFAYGAEVVGWIDMSGVRITDKTMECIGPGDVIISNGSSQLFYKGPRDPVSQTCPSENRTCTDGILSGSFVGLSCDDTRGGANIACARGGKNFEAGDKAIFYKKALVGSTETCESVSVELECSSGKFIDSKGIENTTHNSVKCTKVPTVTEL